jgi:hypothetical protein
MDILHTNDKIYYLPLEQNALEKIWHDSLALTESKYVNVMQFL